MTNIDLDQPFTRCAGSGQPATVIEPGEAQCPVCRMRYWTAMDEPVTAEHAWGDDGRTVRIGSPQTHPSGRRS